MTKPTPMIQQYLLTKQQYPDCILLYRLGDFYEMFFNDAKTASKELEIVLTGRDCGMAERAPMCGVPHHSVDGYIKKLIEKGYKVAICEQTSDPAQSKGLVDREVIRVVTPGTAIEENIIDVQANRYILCAVVRKQALGFAWCDVSTGEFLVDALKTEQPAAAIAAQISRVAPAEILTDDATLGEYADTLHAAKVLVSTLSPVSFTKNAAQEALKAHFKMGSLMGFGLEEGGVETVAAGALMQYLHHTQKNALFHINAIRHSRSDNAMEIDVATRRNLELVAPIMGGGRRHTLLGVLDKTKTSQGSRLLKSYIERPLQSVDEITARLDAVETLMQHLSMRNALGAGLGAVSDLERLCAKISYGTLNARDALAIAKSIRQIPAIKAALESADSPLLCALRDALPDLGVLCQTIETAIVDDPPISVKDGGLIKPRYDQEVDALTTAATEGRQWLMSLEEREREETGIKNLKVGYNRVFGFYIEVTNSQRDAVPYRYVRKQTLVNAERFITQELKELEERILGADEKRIRLEYTLFVELREAIARHIDALQGASRAMATIDVLLSLATAAYENDYVKPAINDSGEISIRDGRHPVVEKTVRGFVPNDIALNGADSRFHLITGPNMSGKSTFMRQVAIIVLMAHIGSFVPAREASICLVDRIFTRVGASDDLASGRSTFMVEMVELANILNHATKDSLIILDEIGRGTSTFDGLSIAIAASEYICERFKGAKTLFATHYHELSELEGRVDGIRNYCVLAHEMENDILFLHRIVSGGTDKSFGIQVAQLAGVPGAVIDRAKALLNDMSRGNGKPGVKTDAAQNDDDDEARRLLTDIAQINIGHLTPLEALNTLNLIKNRAEKLW